MLMERERLIELLTFASICLEHQTNPFDEKYVAFKNITADECKYLARQLSDIIDGWFYGVSSIPRKEFWAAYVKAKKDFDELENHS